MRQIPRRRLALLAAALGVGYYTPRTSVTAQPVDVPGEFANVPLLPGVAGPWSALAGIDPAAVIPQEWQPRGGAVAALPALPGHLQAFVDQAIAWKPAQSGITYHSYGYPNRKLGMAIHLPVCDTLAQLTAYFLSPNTAGLTHFGVGRELGLRIDLTANDGAVWRIPLAPVHQYLAITGEVSPWAQGRINTSGSCPVAPHPIASRMRSGEPNGAYLSVEFVARNGAQGQTNPQFNSGAFLRAMGAAYFRYPISPETQVWHGQIDRVDRCFDPGYAGGPFGGLEAEAQTAARAVLAGDFSLLRDAIRISAPPTPDLSIRRFSRQREYDNAIFHLLRVEEDDRQLAMGMEMPISELKQRSYDTAVRGAVQWEADQQFP